eukprot:575515-Prymnesium_polylepis.3
MSSTSVRVIRAWPRLARSPPSLCFDSARTFVIELLVISTLPCAALKKPPPEPPPEYAVPGPAVRLCSVLSLTLIEPAATHAKPPAIAAKASPSA